MTFFQRIARRALLLAATCLLLPALAQPAAAPQAVPRTPPPMRLGDAVKPLAYDLALTLDPAQDGVSGRVEIDVDIARDTDFFWMNANGTQAKRVVLVAGGQRYEARTQAAADQFLGLDFARVVPAGKARLLIDFGARFSLNETRGLFKQRDGAEWYAFTQFESTNASRVFPCFDEPHWKTPWTLTLTVPRGHVAVANAPAVFEREVEGGMKQVKFATTKPLPTYLVAFGVGPFDVVEGGTAGVNKTKLRYLVPKGRRAETAFAVQATPRLLELAEQYFGSPYPFEKLDSLAIPFTVSFGAMENPGLITYRLGILASRDDRDERFQQRYAGIAAHEIAHMWFGDLVTPAWWDDIWLNESFATWLAGKIVRQYNPAWESTQFREYQRQSAFQVDRLSSSRQVRQPVQVRDDLANAFDRITYEKGGAVLHMFEAQLGEAAFRDGVRRYLKRHEWGNATADDFFRALGEADASLVPAFSSFVLQPGMPLVDFELDCSGAQPAVNLRQQRFLPASELPAQAPPLWTLPVCLRAEGVAAPVCTTLAARQQRLPLPTNQCPTWLLPNPGGNGYFLSRLDARTAGRLASVPLAANEAVTLVAEQALLVTSGAQPLARLLELAAPLARDARPEVASAAANAIGQLNPAAFDAPARARVQAWVREHFGERARALGWAPREGEPDAVRKLRNAVVPLVARVGADAALRAEARALALRWLAGERAPLAGGFRPVLRTAAETADAALFEALTAAARASTDSTTRVEIYKALGEIAEPALLRRAFDHGLSDQADVRESLEMFDAAADHGDNAPLFFDFMRERWDALSARLPEEARARMPRRQQALCTPAQRAAVQQFYAGPRGALPGLQRTLAQALETIDICIRTRALNAVPG